MTLIEQIEFREPSIGNFVIKENEKAPDGRYRLGFMKHITVENGIIIKLK